MSTKERQMAVVPATQCHLPDEIKGESEGEQEKQERKKGQSNNNHVIHTSLHTNRSSRGPKALRREWKRKEKR